MTLLEVLLALSLFSMIMVGASHWLTETAQWNFAARQQLPWRAAAQALLNDIESHLLESDFAASEPRRVEVKENKLSFRTRVPGEDGGRATVLYHYQSAKQQIGREVRVESAETYSSKQTSEPTALGEVAEFRIEILQKPARLFVTIVSNFGESLSQTWSLP